MIKLVLNLVLVGLCVTVVGAQIQKIYPKNESNIKKYEIRIVEVPADTLSVEDTARVRVEMWLDCTNKITSTETLVDTSKGQSKVILAVYGTYTRGPHRPMCVSRRVEKDFFIPFPKPGSWRIETSSTKNDSQQASPWIIIVR